MPMTSATTYRCAVPYCERTFTDSYTLAEHLKMHAGEKRHICPVRTCGRRFSTPGNLSRHKRLHGPIKPLECPVENCICTFRSENKLAKHMKFHLGSAVHVCPAPACGKTFSTAGNLNRHIKGHHPKFDVRAAKALMASQREAMRIHPPPHLAAAAAEVATPSSCVSSPSSSDPDVTASPTTPSTAANSIAPMLSIPASSSMVALNHDSTASAELSKTMLSDMLDPMQLDMLVTLLDVETPTAANVALGFSAPTMGFAPSAGVPVDESWRTTLYHPPPLVLPASHGVMNDAGQFQMHQF